MTKHLIVRGDHGAAGNITLIDDGSTFSFLVTLSTDDVEAQIRCGEPMSVHELAALGNKLVRIAKKAAGR
jgi:hypothetical protein